VLAVRLRPPLRIRRAARCGGGTQRAPPRSASVAQGSQRPERLCRQGDVARWRTSTGWALASSKHAGCTRGRMAGRRGAGKIAQTRRLGARQANSPSEGICKIHARGRARRAHHLQRPERALVHAAAGRGRALEAQVDGLEAALQARAEAQGLRAAALTSIAFEIETLNLYTNRTASAAPYAPPAGRRACPSNMHIGGMWSPTLSLVCMLHRVRAEPALQGSSSSPHSQLKQVCLAVHGCTPGRPPNTRPWEATQHQAAGACCMAPHGGAAAHGARTASRCPNSCSCMSAWPRKATMSTCFCRMPRPGLLYTSPYRCRLARAGDTQRLGQRPCLPAFFL